MENLTPFERQDAENYQKENFAYFDKTINQCTDGELLDFYVIFLNGCDWNNERDQKIYKEFKEEVPRRSKEFQNKVEYLDSVL